MPEEKMCPIHGTPMRYKDGINGGSGWWSHQTEDERYFKNAKGVRWCKGEMPGAKKAGPPVVKQGSDMYQIRTEIAKMCYVEGMGIDWALVQKVQAYVVGGIIPGSDPFPPEAV